MEAVDYLLTKLLLYIMLLYRTHIFYYLVLKVLIVLVANKNAISFSPNKRGKGDEGKGHLVNAVDLYGTIAKEWKTRRNEQRKFEDLQQRSDVSLDSNSANR